MSDSPRNHVALARTFPPRLQPAFLSGRLGSPVPTLRKKGTSGLLLTSVLCLLVWSGYNTGIYYCQDPLFPRNSTNLAHGVRAFFPVLAGVIAAWQLVQRRSLPKWVVSGPLFLLLFYGAIGLASSLFVSSDPFGACYWALEYVSVIVVVMAVASGAEPEAHLGRFISVNWWCCAAICMGLLAGIPLSGGNISRSASSPLGVVAYGGPKEVVGMAGTRNTGFGRFAGIVIMVGLARLLHGRRDKKTLLIWTPLTLAAGLALLLSQARTPWVSVVVGAVMLLARAPTRWRVPIIMVGILALPLVWLSGLAQGFTVYLTRARAFDPTLTGRTVAWAQGWRALQQSPWIGLGFWADRYFLRGANIQSTFFDALIQSGFLGMIPFVIAFVWLWIGILRFYFNKPAGEASSLPGELLAVMAFLTVYSITEITFSFYSVGWMVMAPLIAHVQLRVYQRRRELSTKLAAPGWLRNVAVKPAVASVSSASRTSHGEAE